MFSALRQGNLFYSLDKTNEPKLKIGEVVSVSQPQPKFGQYQPYVTTAETFVDVTVKFDNGAQEEYKQLPSALCIANFNNQNLVVSESRDLMAMEVEAMMRSSQKILDSIAYHEKVVAESDKLLRELNPRFAKEKETDEKIKSLEDGVTNLSATLSDVKDMLSKALNVSSGKKG